MTETDYWQVKRIQETVDVIAKEVHDLKVLFMSINRRLNAVDELYRLFSGKDVGKTYEDDPQ
jgi:hypothetical protein